MMPWLRQARLAVLLLAVAVCASGCWDALPVEITGFSLAMAFDLTPVEHKTLGRFTVTNMVVRPDQLGAGGDGRGSPQATKPFVLVSSTGETIQEAHVRTLNFLADPLQFDHVNVLVIGGDLARSTVTHPIAWAIQHPQVRPSVQVVVAEGDAQKLLDATPATQPLPAQAIDNILQHVNLGGLGFRVSLLRFARDLMNPHRDAVAPIISVTDPLRTRTDPDFQQTPVWAFRGNEGLQEQIVGMAVFKGDRLVGALGGNDAEGLAYLMGESLATVAVPHPQIDGTFVTVAFVDLKVRMTPRLRAEEGKLAVAVEVRGSGDLLESGVVEPVAAGPIQEQVAREAEAEIIRRMESTVRRLKELGADPLGIAETLYRRSPREYRAAADHWEQLLREAEYTFTADITLIRTGLSR